MPAASTREARFLSTISQPTPRVAYFAAAWRSRLVIYLGLDEFTELVLGGGLAATLGHLHGHQLPPLHRRRLDLEAPACRCTQRRVSSRPMLPVATHASVGGVHWPDSTVCARWPFFSSWPGTACGRSSPRTPTRRSLTVGIDRSDAVAAEWLDRRRSVLRPERVSHRPAGMAGRQPAPVLVQARHAHSVPAYWTCLASWPGLTERGAWPAAPAATSLPTS